MNQLRILIADDHEIVRRGLRELLETQEGWAVVGEAVNGRDAVEKALALQPHLVILDVSMPELNGLEATRQIRAALPKTEVLVLTMHDSEQMVGAILAAGARGYVTKSDASVDIVTAIQGLQQHKPFFTPAVSQMVLSGYIKSLESERCEPELTVREREVLQLLAEGKSNKEVAVALAISVKTAETHRANVLHKLNLHSIGDLIHYAVRNKIIAA